MLAAPIIAVRCHYCSDFCNPHELRDIGESIKMCWRCYDERHRPKVEGFNPPKECQGCHVATELLAARELGARFSMFIHWKDGEYQMLCRACSDAYMPKRADLYRDTRFGQLLKI